MKLITNELIKIIKNKFTLTLMVFAILSLIVSYFVIDKKITMYADQDGHHTENIEIKINTCTQWINDNRTPEIGKEIYKEHIKLYEYIKELGPDILGIPYKNEIRRTLEDEISILKSNEKEMDSREFEEQQEKVDRLWDLLENGTFEEYMKFKIEEIKKAYEKEQITEEEYKKQINTEEQNLKYEIGKYYGISYDWKVKLLGYADISEELKYHYNSYNHAYLDDKGIEELKNMKLLTEYRLENNLEPHYSNMVSNTQTGNKYLRYKYHLAARKISMFFIGILAVYLGAICISEERSKGTIKLLLVTPYKRYKILLAKIISIVIVIVVSTLILSQLCTLLGGIFFKGATNEYLYIKNGQVKIMSTYIFETLYYILKIPEIILFLLIGVACSVLMKNKISNIVAIVIYFVSTLKREDLITNAVTNQWNIDFLRYVPSYNLDLVNKVIPIPIYNSFEVNIFQTSMLYSIFVMIVFFGVLLIIAFDGFNKKEM